MEVALRLYSLACRCGSAVKNYLYERNLLEARTAPIPVVSVGNITLGGTGKTPLAIEILSWLASRGRRPALVSRGYRGRWEKRGGTLSDGRRLLATWREGGDEPAMIAARLPRVGVFVGRNKPASCRRARELGFDTAVLDDGFQHRRLARDFDIVLHSPSSTAPLRESSARLKRADAILIEADNGEGVESPDLAAARGAGVPVFRYTVVSRGFRDAATNDPLPADALRAEPVLAFCGIARPGRFRDRLAAEGIAVASFLPFPDHHPYPDASLARIVAAARAAGARLALTTAKDAIKLAGRPRPLEDLRLAVLEIGLELDPRLFALLDSALARHPLPNV